MWGKSQTEIRTFAEYFQELDKDGSGVVEMNLTEVNRTVRNISPCCYCPFCLPLPPTVPVALPDHVRLKSPNCSATSEVTVPASLEDPSP